MGGWPDNLIRVVSLLGVSAPSFVWAVILMLLFAFFLPLFPIAGQTRDTIEQPARRHRLPARGHPDRRQSHRLLQTRLRHIVLPAFALALSGIGQAARLTRANMVETYDKPFIEMARVLWLSGAAYRQPACASGRR